MLREYSMDKQINESVKESIIKEDKELEGLIQIDITEDMKHIVVDAEEESFPYVMTRVLNIYCKYAKGNNLRFIRFVPE